MKKRYVIFLIVLLFLVHTMTGYTTDLKYIFDDFNDSNYMNDFFGSLNYWVGTGAILNLSFESNIIIGNNGCSLKVAYDLTAAGNGGCGFYEYFSYNYQDLDNPSCDLSWLEQFRFRIRGGTAGNFTTKLMLEVTHLNGNRVSIPITGITTNWKEYNIDLPQISGLDQIKQVAFNFWADDVDKKAGTLYFDQFYFIDQEAYPATDDQLLELISRRTFQYFWEFYNPENGLIQDMASSRVNCSIAGVGFGLTAYCIGAERGWVSRDDAAQRTKRILTTLWYQPQSSAVSGTIGYKGFFYHILNMTNAHRLDSGSELSTTDTALCLAGVIMAKEYFDQNNTVENQIRDLAGKIYKRVQWDWFLCSNSGINSNQFYMGWKPETGYFSYWDYFTEEVMQICLLAIGSQDHPVNPETYYSWKREWGSYGSYTMIMSWFNCLHTFYFCQLWHDLRDRVDEHPSIPINWFDNSRTAVLDHRQFCIDNAGTHTTYGANSWGLTHCFSTNGWTHEIGARPWGEPVGSYDLNTIAPAGAGSVIMFLASDPAQNQSVAALKNYFNNYPQLWSIYGFRDCYNLGPTTGKSDDWYRQDHVCLNEGSLLIAIENYRSGFVWNTFMKNEWVRKGVYSVFPASQGVVKADASDGIHSAVLLDGSERLGDKNIKVRIKLREPLGSYGYGRIKLWYDINKAPDGAGGASSTDQSVSMKSNNNYWEAIISVDPEDIKEDDQVQFIVDIYDSLYFRTAGKSWKYRISKFFLQEKGITVLNNLINPKEDEVTAVLYSRPENVSINVYNISGCLIRRLILDNGMARWDGRDLNGRIVPNGLYLIKIWGKDINETRKVVVLY